jgi:hypothetical protein
MVTKPSPINVSRIVEGSGVSSGTISETLYVSVVPPKVSTEAGKRERVLPLESVHVAAGGHEHR